MPFPIRHASTACLATIVLASLVATASVEAASLRVSPILIDSGENANATITLHNHETRPLNAQVRVFRWTQSGGEDQLVPVDDVIASPPIVSIEANQDYVVRLQRTSGQQPVNEESYRIVVDELPNPNRQRNGTVAVVLRYIVPAFFFPADASQPRVKWSLGVSDGRSVLMAENSGDKRLQVVDLGLKTGNRVSVVQKGLAGYVLGHSTRIWPLGSKLVRSGGSTVVAMSDHGAIHATLSP
jgi:fimbrial chaperone protein